MHMGSYCSYNYYEHKTIINMRLLTIFKKLRWLNGQSIRRCKYCKEYAGVKKKFMIFSGKGGVGKTTTAVKSRLLYHVKRL